MSDIWNFFGRVWTYIPPSVRARLVKAKDINSVNQVSLTVVATSAKTLDIIVKTPKVRKLKLFTRKHGIIYFFK